MKDPIQKSEALLVSPRAGGTILLSMKRCPSHSTVSYLQMEKSEAKGRMLYTLVFSWDQVSGPCRSDGTNVVVRLSAQKIISEELATSVYEVWKAVLKDSDIEPISGIYDGVSCEFSVRHNDDKENQIVANVSPYEGIGRVLNLLGVMMIRLTVEDLHPDASQLHELASILLVRRSSLADAARRVDLVEELNRWIRSVRRYNVEADPYKLRLKATAETEKKMSKLILPEFVLRGESIDAALRRWQRDAMQVQPDTAWLREIVWRFYPDSFGVFPVNNISMSLRDVSMLNALQYILLSAQLQCRETESGLELFWEQEYKTGEDWSPESWIYHTFFRASIRSIRDPRNTASGSQHILSAPEKSIKKGEEEVGEDSQDSPRAPAPKP